MRRLPALAILLTLAGGATAAGADSLFKLPLTGELSGEVRARQFPSVPALPWRMTIHPAAQGSREGEVAVDGPGTTLRARLTIDAAGEASWKLTAAEIDPGTWFPAMAPALGAIANGAVVTGLVKLEGQGTLNSGGAAGVVKVIWRGGKVSSATAGWSLEGVTLDGEFAIDSAKGSVKSRGPAELTVRTITTRRFGARNLFVRGELDGAGGLAVSDARLEIAGGDVALDSFTMPLAPPKLGVHLRIAHIGLQDVVALAPAGLADARGRVSGDVQVDWSEAKGFELGAGHLSLDRDEPAVVQLTPAPGMLTSRVPKQFDLLPAWMGPLAKWFRPKDPAYAEMQSIELGHTVLQVESLDLRLTPEGDERGRTATVRIVARPDKADSAVKQVTFDINVAGPLAAVLRMGMNQSLSLNAH